MKHRSWKVHLLLFCLASFSLPKGKSLIAPSSFVRNQRNDHIVNQLTTPLLMRGGNDSTTELRDQSSDNNEIIMSSENSPDDRILGQPNSQKMGPNSSSPGFIRKLFPSLPWQKLPNWLTYARCFLIPALIIQFYISKYHNKNIHSSFIFAIASITDFFDGYLARRWDICSPFGAFLDPVADKLMVSTALIILSGKYGYLVAIPSSIILAREIAVSALREWMASRGQRDSVKVGFQGKVKTAATMLALTIVLSIPDDVGLKWKIKDVMQYAGFTWTSLMSAGVLLLFLSCIVTVTSGLVYFKAAAPVLLG